MRTVSALLLVAGLVPFCTRPATAQATALSVAGPPISMTVTTPAAGSQPAGLSNVATTYTVRVRASAGVKKITAQINSPMPFGTTLTITMAPPTGATSLGPVSLSTTAKDVIVNISNINPATTKGTTYVFAATVAAGVVPSQSRTVTLTIANYP